MGGNSDVITPKTTNQFENNVDSFREWLQKSAGLSKKSASDCISRCRRVQRELSIDLHDAVSDKDSYRLLVKQVKGIAFTTDLKTACGKYSKFIG